MKKIALFTGSMLVTIGVAFSAILAQSMLPVLPSAVGLLS